MGAQNGSECGVHQVRGRMVIAGKQSFLYIDAGLALRLNIGGQAVHKMNYQVILFLVSVTSMRSPSNSNQPVSPTWPPLSA